jgi:hypothetical protein
MELSLVLPIFNQLKDGTGEMTSADGSRGVLGSFAISGSYADMRGNLERSENDQPACLEKK